MSDESQLIALRDNAESELQQIKTIEQGMTHLNKLKSIETWVKLEKKDAKLQNMIAEQKLRTQRVLGELLGAMDLPGRNGGDVKSSAAKELDSLADLGITKKDSSSFQKIASIPNEEFEAFISEKKDAVNKAVNELTTAGALRLANGKPAASYSEENRVVGYLNSKYARLLRAYAYDKSQDVSAVVVIACRMFLDIIPEGEHKRLLFNYLSSTKEAGVR